MGRHQEDAKVFKALCDPKRLAILEQLRSGEKCACTVVVASISVLRLRLAGANGSYAVRAVLPHENPV